MMYDVIIVGGGPAGLSCGVYCGRAGLKTLLIEKIFTGGQMATTFEVDNYIGFEEAISGAELAMKMETHAKKFGVEIINCEVLETDLDGAIKSINTTKGVYEAKALVLAMGAIPRELDLPNERNLRSKGVSYCATCDGAFFRGKQVAVVGGGDTALEDAIFLANFCPSVHLIHRRDSFNGAKILVEKVMKTKNINIIFDSEVTEIIGTDALEAITVKNNKSGAQTNIDVAGMFVAIGVSPQNQLAIWKLEMTKNGYIVSDEDMCTSKKGVFVCGDVRKKPLRQIITAAADGAIASYSAQKYIFSELKD